MCLTIPAQVIEINQECQTAMVNFENKGRTTIDVHLVKNLKIHDYLLVHNNIAVQKLSKNEAQKIINLFKKNKISKEGKICKG